jgi:hypothetical protein
VEVNVLGLAGIQYSRPAGMDAVEAEEQQTEPPDEEEEEGFVEKDPTGRFIRVCRLHLSKLRFFLDQIRFMSLYDDYMI